VYAWSPQEFLAPADSPSPMIWPLEDKAYTVLIKDTVCGRMGILVAGVAVHPLPEIKASAKDIDCGRQFGQLSASGGVKYTWQPTDGLSDAATASPIVTIEKNTVFVVTGIDENGCFDIASVEVKVFEGDGRLFAPTAFTPNGDGKNDCFKVKIPGDVSHFTLSIVNRFGQEVFRSHNVLDCWDGSFNGVQQPVGTYFYFYRGRSTTCDNLFRKGDIQLVR
jgi:gliding motility-associated-like protein